MYVCMYVCVCIIKKFMVLTSSLGELMKDQILLHC